jgi:DNA-binding winged helix-turn-helix (wHTH) protein
MEMFQFASFSVDPCERVVFHNGTRLSLTPKVFETLLCFVRNPGRVLTKDELLKQIWPDTFVEEVNLAVNISTLRKALGENSQNRYIATVPGRGYQFVAEVARSLMWKHEKATASSKTGPYHRELSGIYRLPSGKLAPKASLDLYFQSCLFSSSP